MSVAERLKESKLIRGLRAKRLRPATLKSQSESVQSCYHNREDTTAAAAGEEAEGWPPTHHDSSIQQYSLQCIHRFSSVHSVRIISLLTMITEVN